MNNSTKQYTVGRGKLYLGKFAPGTETVVGGEMYFGNTPSITIAATYNDLPHYSSDDQNQFQDDNFTLRTDRNLTFTCDNMSMQTWGIMLGTDPIDETQTATTAATETLTDVALGRYYQLGMSAATPDGWGTVDNVAITAGATPVVEAGNYEVDFANGRIYILPDATDIVAGDDLTVTFDAVMQSSTLVVESGVPIEGSLRYVADNPKGGNKNLYWPHVKLQPSGDLQLKGDTWQVATFTGMVIQPTDTRNRVYVREPL
jgi:hypothetical protein